MTKFTSNQTDSSKDNTEVASDDASASTSDTATDTSSKAASPSQIQEGSIPSKIPIFSKPSALYYLIALGIVSVVATGTLFSITYLKTDKSKAIAIGVSSSLTALLGQLIVKGTANHFQNKKI